MSPIQIPAEWDDNGILLFEEFCSFIRTPQRTVRDWKRRTLARVGGASTGTAASTPPSPNYAASSPLVNVHRERSEK